MKAGLPRMPDGPPAISVSVDPRCNLACPSCRKGPIRRVTTEQQAILDRVASLLESSRESLQTVRLAGYGEALFSPFLRQLLKGLSRERYPNLDFVFLLTNGLLMNEMSFEDLKPGSDHIRRIAVSIDAGNAEIYRKVRGGDWNVLMKNLEWASGLRKSGRLDDFSISFVARETNFSTIPEFVSLGRSLGVDRILFSQFQDWGVMSRAEYEREAIHLPGHPKHRELLALYRQFREEPTVSFSISLADPEMAR